MKAIWVLTVTLAVALADVSHLGYHYKVPQTSYGVPSYQSGEGSGYKSFSNFGSGGYSGSGYQGSGYKNSGSGSGYSSGADSGVSGAFASSLGSGASSSFGSSLGSGSTTYGLGSGLSTGSGSGYYQSSNAGSSDHVAQPIYQYSGSSGLGEYQNHYSSQYQTSALEKYQNYYQIHQQPTQVFKHFYVHAAPEEPERPKARPQIVLPPPQKHYKIIFVKAPTVTQSQIVTVPQVQNEEKTIVYVLVNKPDQNQEIIVPKVEQKPPSKPEVYFIKYKNKEDSQSVIDKIVKDYNKGHSGVSDGASSSLSGSSSLTGDYASSNVASSTATTGLNSGYEQNSGFVNSGVGSNYQSSEYNGGYNTAGLGGAQHTTLSSSGFYDNPAHSEASVDSFGSQAYAVSGSQPVQNLNILNGGSLSSVSSPVTVSSTASSVSYDNGNVVSTSQGVPHETYGPPKFRLN